MPRSDPELADPKSIMMARRCPHCERFLKEAYQTGEGVRLCKECLHEIQRYAYIYHKRCVGWGTWPVTEHVYWPQCSTLPWAFMRKVFSTCLCVCVFLSVCLSVFLLVKVSLC